MPKQSQSPVAIAMSAFSQNVKSLMEAQSVPNDTELWRMAVKRSRVKLGQKTVNNTVKGRHDAKISTLESIAEALHVPLWVLFIPGLKDKDLRSPNKERIIALMQGYLACTDTDRQHLENTAAAFAAKQK